MVLDGYYIKVNEKIEKEIVEWFLIKLNFVFELNILNVVKNIIEKVCMIIFKL